MTGILCWSDLKVSKYSIRSSNWGGGWYSVVQHKKYPPAYPTSRIPYLADTLPPGYTTPSPGYPTPGIPSPFGYPTPSNILSPEKGMGPEITYPWKGHGTSDQEGTWNQRYPTPIPASVNETLVSENITFPFLINRNPELKFVNESNSGWFIVYDTSNKNLPEAEQLVLWPDQSPSITGQLPLFSGLVALHRRCCFCPPH